jgi:hypothetical protein
MTNIFTILLLYIIWFTFWGIYNYILLPKKFSLNKSSNLLSITFLIITIIIVLISNNQLLESSLYYWVIWCSIILFAFITNKKEFGRISNSLFQITWFFCLLQVVDSNMIYSSLLFGIGHLPVFFVKRLSFFAKLLLVILSTLGGIIFYLILIRSLNYPLNLIITTLIHFIFYYIFKPLDTKFNLKIIT